MSIQTYRTRDGYIAERFYTKSKNITKHKWVRGKCANCGIVKQNIKRDGKTYSYYTQANGVYLSNKAPECITI